MAAISDFFELRYILTWTQNFQTVQCLMFCNIFEVWISYIRFCNFLYSEDRQTDGGRTDQQTGRPTGRQTKRQKD